MNKKGNNLSDAFHYASNLLGVPLAVIFQAMDDVAVESEPDEVFPKAETLNKYCSKSFTPQYSLSRYAQLREIFLQAMEELAKKSKSVASLWARYEIEIISKFDAIHEQAVNDQYQ